MSFVRLTVLSSVVFIASAVAASQPASRTDGVPPLRNWPVASDALVPEVSALPSAASHFIEMAPCRVYDSRVVAGGPGPIPSGVSRTVPIAGAACAGVPASAAGYSLNFTVTGSASTGSYAFLTAYPTGTPRPNAATVNFKSGTQVGNAAIVAAGTFGMIDVYVSLQTEVIVDINGYFAEGVVTSVVAGTGLSGGGTGDVNVSIADGGVGAAQLSATGSTAGQVLASNGTTVEWQTANGATGAAGGDLTGTYPNPTVATVWGTPAANIASGAMLANGATPFNSPSSVVMRDSTGNFYAGTIWANLNGTATNFSGTLSGQVTGTQNATVVSNAVSTNTPNAIVRRDGSGNFSAGTITAALNGNAATATNFSGSLAGEVTGTQGATVVSNAVSANTANAIVRRNASGDFSAGTVSASGLSLPFTTANGGAVLLGGTRFAHGFGPDNTFFGLATGNFTLTGGYNVAIGAYGLTSNTSGYNNTATGFQSLMSNTSGYANTANGYSSLTDNTTGCCNTAVGHQSMGMNVNGFDNTGIGAGALTFNSAGNNNSAVGYFALNANTTGGANTAVGKNALMQNTTGAGNIAIGENAGYSLTVGNYNIDIGNQGQTGESGTIRIGNAAAQSKAFIAGIRGVTTVNANAIPVLIDSAGQLGTASSSRRFKFDIADMDHATDDLMRLRPVTFRYLAHGDRAPLQYGLIAEEVAEVYPQLVAVDRDGQAETVMYQFLAPMLLNVVQQQQKTIDTLEQRIAALEEAIGGLKRKP